MHLASRRDGTADAQPLVVSPDLEARHSDGRPGPFGSIEQRVVRAG